MKKILYLILLLLLILVLTASCIAQSQKETPQSQNVPKALIPFKEKIRKARSYNEALQITIDMYGKPHDDIGSGLHIPIWFIDGGRLSVGAYHKNGEGYYLIDSTNKVTDNLISSYACDIPDSDPYGNSYWLGSLELEKSGKFRFIPGGEQEITPGPRKQKLEDNFFLKNQTGTYTIDYQNNVRKDSILENIKDGTIIAKLVFVSGKAEEGINVKINKRNLVLQNSKEEWNGIRINRSWNNRFYTE